MAYVGYYKQSIHSYIIFFFLFFGTQLKLNAPKKKVPRLSISVVSVSRVPGEVEHAVPKQRIPQ
jgi:hypothetical protein